MNNIYSVNNFERNYENENYQNNNIYDNFPLLLVISYL